MIKRRPTLTNIIISLIFFLLGIGANMLMDRGRKPIYTVINSPSLIFDKTNASSKIKLMVDDTIPIRDNVYVTTLALWNEGDVAIEKQDIRKDFFVFTTDSIARILDSKIVQEKEAGISNFKVTPIGDSLKVEWDHFDPKYGLKLQILYTGNKATEIVLTGSVLGATVKKVKERNSIPLALQIIVSIVMLGLLYLVVWLLYQTLKDSIKNEKQLKGFKRFLPPLVILIFAFSSVMFVIWKLLPLLYFTYKVPF